MITFLWRFSRRTIWREVAAMIIFAAAVTIVSSTPPAQASGTVNLVADSLVLTDAQGHTHLNNVFAPNEPIYVQVGVHNSGTVSAPSGVVTEIYANKPSTVLVHTKDTPEFVIHHGTFYPTTSPYIYESFSGGHWQSAFGTTKSFSQSATGTYTARIYVDADNLVSENGYDNQRTATYTIANPTNLTATSLQLVDSRGYAHQNNVFAPNEPIYVRVGVQNKGPETAPAGVQTEVYANRPSAVSAGTKDSPEFVVTHGTFYASSSPYVYESFSGGHWSSAFGSTRYFRQAYAGTYTARIFVDYANGVRETNESDNQLAVTYSITNSWPQPVVNPSAIDTIVNKKYVLPSTYYPNDLVQVNFDNNGQPLRWVAAQAMNQMRAAAANQGVYMRLISGFRSYDTQVSTYNYWVDQVGQSAADAASARPGHSEHQTGLAADMSDEYNTGCDLSACFGDTAAGRWLANYAQNYGFIIRYPYGLDWITGYEYEPWHVRYVGVSLAKAIKSSGLTVEQYFHVPGGDY